MTVTPNELHQIRQREKLKVALKILEHCRHLSMSAKDLVSNLIEDALHSGVASQKEEDSHKEGN